MQFTTITTATLLLASAIPALATNPTTTTISTSAPAPFATPAQTAQEAAAELSQVSAAIEKELSDCISTSGATAYTCFNRQAGMDIPTTSAMTAAMIATATTKYAQLVGASLATCATDKGFYKCLKEIEVADDKASFNFKRSGFSDFIGGFKKGFTGVIKPVFGLVI